MESGNARKIMVSGSDTNGNKEMISWYKNRDPREEKTGHLILHYIIESPGSHFSKIRSALKLNSGTLTHHIRKLEEEGLVKSIRCGKEKQFYSRGAVPKNKPLSSKENEVFHIIERNPGISSLEIASLTGKTRQNASYHTTNLSDSGLIVPIMKGRTLYWYCNEGEQPGKKNQ